MKRSENDLEGADEETTAQGARRRPRMLAGGTLGLAGIGAGLVLALTGGGTAAAHPARTVEQHGTDAVVVHIDSGATYAAANRMLNARDSEGVSIDMAQGAATRQGPVACTPRQGLEAPKGSAVSVLIGQNGTDYPQQTMANTGATGAFHLVKCQYFATGANGVAVGNSGNTGQS